MVFDGTRWKQGVRYGSGWEGASVRGINLPPANCRWYGAVSISGKSVEKTDNDNNEGILRQVGVFPLLVGILGLGSFIAGLVVLGVAIYNPEMREKIDAVREIAIVPALFIVGGLLMFGTFLLLREMRSLERKMGALTEQAFDREVAALLAALRPFAERLEERIGPVLTASQKLQKPLDTVHLDLQSQGQQIQDLTNGFDELKMLLNRTRDDVAAMGKGKSLEPLQKQLEELGTALKNPAAPKVDLQPIQTKMQGLEKQLQEFAFEIKALREKKIEFPRIDFPKVEIPSYEPLQKTMEESIATIRDRVESLAQMLAQMPSPVAAPAEGASSAHAEALGALHKEIAAGRETVERCLSAAQTAAEAAQRAASAAEQASNRADRVEQTLRSMPAAPAPATPAAAPAESAASAAPRALPENLPAIKPPEEPAAAAPQEKRSIKDAIAKLRMLRGGPG